MSQNGQTHFKNLAAFCGLKAVYARDCSFNINPYLFSFICRGTKVRDFSNYFKHLRLNTPLTLSSTFNRLDDLPLQKS